MPESNKRKALMDKYPKLFNLDGRLTCTFGIATGDGWLPLVDALCEYLQWNIDNNSHLPQYQQVNFVQIKEKFGGLRAYIGPGSTEQFAAIAFAEALSSHVCEHCGKWVEKSAQDPEAVWKLTLCVGCEADRVASEIFRQQEAMRCQRKKRKARSRN